MDADRLLLEFHEARTAAAANERARVRAWLWRTAALYRAEGGDAFADLCEWAATEIGACAHLAEADR